MSYKLNVLKDFPIMFMPLDKQTGLYKPDTYDASGCYNNGTYSGSLTAAILPIVQGCKYSVMITNSKYITASINKNFYAISSVPGFGTKYTKDNDFSMEIWIKPFISIATSTPIFADETSVFGIYYENDQIVFKMAGQKLECLLDTKDKAMHIVCTYSLNAMSIYIDGVLSATKSISGFSFLNTNLTLKIGPTKNTTDNFICSAPAVYRYSLSDQKIYSHYISGIKSISATQISKPNNGILFSLNQQSVKSAFKYRFSELDLDLIFNQSNIYYDQNKNKLEFYSSVGSPTYTIEKIIIIPSNVDINSSKIEWASENGIVVQTSINNIDWQTCENGYAIPQYKRGFVSSERTLYLKIIMSTNEANNIMPTLSYFQIDLFSTNKIQADSSDSYIYSDSEYSLAKNNYPALLRKKINGISVKNDGYFKTSTMTKDVYGIELFYMPTTVNTNGGIIFASGTKFEWKSGTILKQNISNIFINGIDRTADTSAATVFLNNQINHVFIIFSSPISSSEFTFNKISDGAPAPWTAASYKDIIFYNSAVDIVMAVEHYNFATGISSNSDAISTMTISENQSRLQTLINIGALSGTWVVTKTV